MSEQDTVSTADVKTSRPERYGKQLVSHLSRRSVGTWDESTGRGAITFEQGSATLVADGDSLLLQVRAAADHLPRLEDVVGRHLVRFATRDVLDVAWQRSDGSAGTHQRSEEPDSGSGETR